MYVNNINKKENISLGIFFISLFLIGFLIFNVISQQIIIKINDTKEVVITQPFNIVHVIAIIILTIAATISFHFYFGNLMSKKKESMKKNIVIQCLDENEKKIYELLNKRGDLIQYEISNELNFSKVKTSRIIEKMAKKGLIKKYRRGYSNKIKIN
jgi:uncharacterized membrane protein